MVIKEESYFLRLLRNRNSHSLKFLFLLDKGTRIIIHNNKSMNRVLSLYQKLEHKPFGKRIFSGIVARMAPYFTTIRPRVHDIRANHITVSMKKRRAVHNHLKTVHAIASCNLCEFAAGLCMEASIPSHRRWIPMGMDVAYLKKAETDITATCDLSWVDWDHCEKVPCVVSIKDTRGVEVVKATITMYVTDKPNKTK